MRNLVRLMREYMAPYWGRMLLAIAMTSLVALSPYAFGFLGKVMVDNVLEVGAGKGTSLSAEGEGTSAETAPAEPATAPQGKSVPEKLKLLGMVFLAYVAVHLLSIAFSWVYQYNIAYVGQKIVFTLREQLHRKLQTLQMSFFDRRQTGKIMSRVLDDVDVIRANATWTFSSMFSDIAMLFIGAFILLKLNPKLSLIAFGTLPFYGISYRIFSSRIEENNREIRERNAEVYGLVEEKIYGVKVVKAFAQEMRELRAFFRKAGELTRLAIKGSVYQTVIGSISSIISIIGTTAIMWRGALEVKAGAMTLGELLFFYSCTSYLFSPVIRMSNMGVVLQWVMVVLGRVFEILDQEVSIKDSPSAIALDHFKGHVKFEGVWFRYSDDGDYVLKDINLDIPPGTMVSIVGPSGSGKTTLVSLIPRLYDVTRGRILIDGVDVRDIKLSCLRKRIGIVPQDPILFTGTIAENIKYGRTDATPSQVMRAAKAAELHDFILTLPAKYETIIGEKGVSLSGGQKQRLAMAMALLTDPDILILDDSTSALDAETEAKIWGTLERVLRGRTSFVITHRIATAKRADLVVVLDEGRVIEIGVHEQLLAKGGLYRRMFEQQTAQGEDAVAVEAAVAG